MREAVAARRPDRCGFIKQTVQREKSKNMLHKKIRLDVAIKKKP